MAQITRVGCAGGGGGGVGGCGKVMDSEISKNIWAWEQPHHLVIMGPGSSSFLSVKGARLE